MHFHVLFHIPNPNLSLPFPMLLVHFHVPNHSLMFANLPLDCHLLANLPFSQTQPPFSSYDHNWLIITWSNGFYVATTKCSITPNCFLIHGLWPVDVREETTTKLINCKPNPNFKIEVCFNFSTFFQSSWLFCCVYNLQFPSI